jgi:glyoxylase-like metal-dependent hydrolase (beta-lactamase superfamily II)
MTTAPIVESSGASPPAFRVGGLVDRVASDHAVADEVRLKRTPGHTPGHSGTRIRSGGAEAVITGDLTHHPIQCCDPRIGSRFDPGAAPAFATCMRFLRAQADRDAVVRGTHFAAPRAARIVATGDAWALRRRRVRRCAPTLQPFGIGRGRPLPSIAT